MTLQKRKILFMEGVMEAIFWRKDIDHAIKSHDDDNERINVITVNMKEHPLCIINVYMPSDNSNRDEQY